MAVERATQLRIDYYVYYVARAKVADKVLVTTLAHIYVPIK